MPGPLDRAEEEELAYSLSDTPFGFGPRCVLQRHAGRAWAIGPLRSARAAVVQASWLPSEPMVFGEDAEAICTLLRSVPGWDSVHCPTELAEALGRGIERILGAPTGRLGDLYFTLDTPPVSHAHPAVRRLTEADLELVESAPSALHPVGFDSVLAALSGGCAAGAVVDGRLVGIVCMTVSSEEHADLGATVLEPWRNQGIARAAASLVAAEVQARGLRPVWSTGENNLPSQSVARSLGFELYGRMEYVTAPSLQGSEGFRPGSAR